MIFWRYISTIVILVLSLTVHCQNPVSVNYTTENGLPSDFTYDLYQAKDGKMWITSDLGLTYWNGATFNTININQSNPSGVYSFFVESDNKVWVSTSSNKIYWFDPLTPKPKFHAYEHNDSLKFALDNHYRKEFIRQIWMDNGKMHFSFISGVGFLSIDKYGNTLFSNTFLPLEYPSGVITTNFVRNLNLVIRCEKNRLIHAYIEVNENDSEPRTNIILNGNLTGSLPPFSTNQLSDHIGVSGSCIHEENVYLVAGNDLFIIPKNNTPQNVKLRSRGLDVILHNGEIYVATDRGIEIFGTDGSFRKKIFPELFVSSLLKDKKNKLWFSTQGYGIWKIPFTESGKILTDEKLCRSIKKISSNGDYLSIFTSNRKLLVYDRTIDLVGAFENVEEYRECIFYHSESPELAPFFGAPIAQYKPSGHHRKMYHLQHLKEDTVIRSGKSTLNIFMKDSIMGVSLSDIPDILCTMIIDSCKVLIGTEQGLFMFNTNNSVVPLFDHKKQLKAPIKELSRWNNEIVVSTGNNGIFLLDLAQNRIERIEGTGLRIKDRAVQDDQNLWIHDEFGISLIQRNKDSGIDGDLNRHEFDFAVKSSNVKEIEVFGGKLWLATKDYLAYYDLPDSIPRMSINAYTLRIDSVLVNSKYYQNSKNIRLDQGDFLEIFVSQPSYDVDLVYEYKTPENSNRWIRSESGLLVLNDLDAGEHSIQIRSLDETGRILDKHSVQLYVIAPWYERKWALFAFILIGLGLIYVLFLWLRFSINSKKNKEIEQLNLEMNVLLGQMNPHFMFNSINAIQSFIVQNDKLEALDYLGNFAKLIRNVLDFSREGAISWEEEKNFLSLYTKLEHERFEKNIELSFSENFYSKNENVYLPPLLLQPIVENSIVHGLNHELNEIYINVSITEEKDFYSFKITDTGKGFNEAEKNALTKSHGLSILLRRIEIYNQELPSNFRIYNNKESGVTVEFQLRKEISVLS
ncbi:MAG: histidine kinase [Crocinitomicaceae bacterium]|nr:histidine kinase [Crocinitomicaceae bacterium]